MRCKSRNLWIKPGLIFIFLSLYICSGNLAAQELKLVNEWSVNDVVDATADFSGNLYISNEQGVIIKYDKSGTVQISYSGPLKSPIYSIDASHTSKIFGFYRDQQSYLILDRFLNPLNEANLSPSVAGFVTETAYSADNNLWLFDQSDLSIKKVNLFNKVVTTSSTIPLVIANEEWDLLQIEEYQNKIYLYNSSKDIYLFDNLGNYIRKLGISSDCQICFDGGQLVFIQDSKILAFNIYKNDITEVGEIDSTNDILKIISANNFIYLIFKNKISVYK
jgi:hypothetical protein